MNVSLFQTASRKVGKRERTRAALLDSALGLVAKQGMETVKISEITKHAGLANGTFYNYFSDREEIIWEVSFGIAKEISRQIDDEMSGIEDGVERVLTATTAFIEIAVDQPEWGAVVISSNQHTSEMRQDVTKFLRADLQLGLEQGQFSVTLDQYLLDQIGSLIIVCIRTQLDEGADVHLTRRACDYILRLLGVPLADIPKLLAKHSKLTQVPH
ncbi:MAG: TetR/AcrR family transcriptional regulator [Parvibaculaceae bacterium]|nr:TetR/AcrR family transcriptional regulator [Parvibaculaceae bacterium]